MTKHAVGGGGPEDDRVAHRPEEVLARTQQWARTLWEPGRRWTPGEIAWSMLTAPHDPVALLLADGVAWRNDDVVVILSSDQGSIRAGIEWAQDAPVEASSGDALLEAELRRAGRHELPGGPFALAVQQSTAGAPRAVPPPGYVLRPAASGDDLVGVHRSSWRPSDLPFAAGHRPEFDQHAQSSFTGELLASVQAVWPYRLELHLVAADREGRLVASCIVWLDDRSGVASIEPLGVDPGHRRRGLARALSAYAVEEVRRAGGSDVVIHPRGDDAYPAPRSAYLLAGFAPTGRTMIYAPGPSASTSS